VEAQLEAQSGTRVLASAEGGTKKEAQQKAAELALERWDVVEASQHEGAA
jgi:ribonuclease-3